MGYSQGGGMTEAKMASECCPQCGGVGYFVVPRHVRGCTWEKYASTCPIPEQEMCDFCGGTGMIEQPTTVRKEEKKNG